MTTTTGVTWHHKTRPPTQRGGGPRTNGVTPPQAPAVYAQQINTSDRSVMNKSTAWDWWTPRDNKGAGA